MASRLQSPPFVDQIKVGPEVEAFAIQLDDCLSGASRYDEIRDRVMRLVNDFFNYANNQVISIKALHRAQGSPNKADGEPSLLPLWEQEAQTWDLLRRVLPLRYPAPIHNNHSRTVLPIIEKSKEPLYDIVWNQFLDAEPSAIERFAILQWIQQNRNTTTAKSNHGNDNTITQGPLCDTYTKPSINQRKSDIAYNGPITDCDDSSRRSYITHSSGGSAMRLDPDAITRQQKQLIPPDSISEDSLSQQIFDSLRWGRDLDTIRDLCATQNEIWRAASIFPFPPSADIVASISSKSKVDPQHYLDVGCFVLWRHMCLHNSRHGGKSNFERAIYGILAGDIASVEPVCANWDDLLYMHYNSLLRTQFNHYLVHQKASDLSLASCRIFSALDAQKTRDEPGHLSEVTIIRSIESSPIACSEALRPLKALQAAIITREIDNYLGEQGAVLAAEANLISPSQLMPKLGEISKDINKDKYIRLSDHFGLRILAHVLLILSILDRLDSTNSSSSGNTTSNLSRQHHRENVLVGYIGYLRLAGLEALIPLYCSELKEPRLYEVLHMNLIHLTDPTIRSQQLDLMRKASIDPLKFVLAQSNIAIKTLPAVDDSRFTFNILEAVKSLKYGRNIRPDFFGDESERIDYSDDVLIRIAEWQLLLEDAWPSLFDVIIHLYGYFLVLGRLNSARSLANRVKCLDIIHRCRSPGSDFDPLWDQEMEFWGQRLASIGHTEQSCTRVATDAKTLRQFESLINALDSIETLARLSSISKQGTTLRRDFWVKVGIEMKNVNHHIKPLYSCWLKPDGQGEVLQSVRDIYLTEAVLAHISCLHFVGTCLSRDHLLESMELATLISGGHSDVVSSFIKSNRMAELLEAFASCSKALAVLSAETRPVSSAMAKKARLTGWTKDLWSI